MAESIVLHLGLPFGHWSDLVPASVGDAWISASSMEKLHTEIMPLPSLANWPTQREQAWFSVRPEPKDLHEWLDVHGPGSAWGSDARLCWTGLALADALPCARFVVWVEHPASALANRLRTATQTLDPAGALSLLHSAAYGMSQLVQRHAERCLVIEWEEAAARPAALVERLTQWVSRPVRPSAAPVTQVDTLALALATSWVATDSTLTRIHERLYASCTILDVGVTEQASMPEVGKVIPAALRAYVELVERTKNLELLATKLQLAEEEGAQALRVVRDAATENAQLLAQLQLVQHELETNFLQGRRSDEQLSVARKSLEAADAELKRLRAGHAVLSQDGDLLLIQLHQVQEELEQYYLACHELENVVTLSEGGRGSVRVASMEAGATSEEAPHRGLTLTLRGVAGDDREIQRLLVRLVDHHGRAGLALFDGGDGGKPLMAWEPTGEEDGRPFMLLIPDDAPSRRHLLRLGAGDWQFVRGLAIAVVRHLSDQRTSRWSVLAKRLVKSLADLPPRFRFDDVVVKADSTSPECWLVTFQHVVFGEREVPKLEIRWRPQGGAMIELLVPDDAGVVPLLGAWPVQERGELSPSWRLPLGGADRMSNEKAWRAFSRNDRDLLLGLLDAMPVAALPISGLGGLGPDGAQKLASVASDMLREANRLLHGSRLRRVWRSVIGRLTS